jgi:hypothetical protein
MTGNQNTLTVLSRQEPLSGLWVRHRQSSNPCNGQHGLPGNCLLGRPSLSHTTIFSTGIPLFCAKTDCCYSGLIQAA